jgi:hypothetical protein
MLSNFYTSKLGSFVPTGSTNRYIVTVDTNRFVVGSSTDHTLRVWKSTDSGSTWVEADGANRKAIKYQPGASPLNGGAIAWCDFDGATVHIAYLLQEAASGSQGFIEIVTFSTASDTWGSVITGGPTTLNYSGQQYTAGFTGFTINRRGSDYVVHYQGTKENVGGNKDRVYRAVYSGGAWGAGVAVDGQAGLNTNFAITGTVAGASSRIHVFMRKVIDPFTLDEMVHITLKSDNTYDVGGIQTLTGLDLSFDEGKIAVGINLSGEIIVPFMPEDAGPVNQDSLKVMTATSADAPTWSTQTVYAGGLQSPAQSGTRPSIGIGAIGATPYVIWAGNEVAGAEVIYQSTRTAGVWSAPTAAFAINHFIDALTVTHFSTSLEITTTGLDEGDVGLPYSETISSTGTGTWEITAGAAGLGAIGLTLSSGGVLSGTPTGSGSFTFTVRITDSDGNTDTQDLTLVINPTSPFWTPGNPGDDGWHLEEDEGRGGAGDTAACRTADGVNPMADLIASPKVDVVAGQIYYIEAFGIADPGTSGQLEIGMKFYNSAGLFMSEVFTILGGAPTVYTRWSTTITVPVNAVQAEFVVRVEGHLAGKWCVDDAWWTQLDTRWELSSVKHYSSDYAAYR